LVFSVLGFLFYADIKTFKVPGFSVLSQRVDTSKSAALSEKWDGAGKFVDMIWE
jgi:hypothetical protein